MKRRAGAVGPKLLLDQPHMTTCGKEVVSHLLVWPKGQEVHWAIRALFALDVGGSRARTAWNPISDQGIAGQFPGCQVYWLCPARRYSAGWVQRVVEAILSEEPVLKRKLENVVDLSSIG